MKLVIEARLESEDSHAPSEPIKIAVLDRPDEDWISWGLPWERLRSGEPKNRRVSAGRRGVPKAEIHARTTHGVTRCASSFLKHSLQPSLCSSRRIGVSKPVC